MLKGRPDIVELLLAAGANVGKRYRGGQTVLHLAAARGLTPVVNQLISAKADLAATDELGNTPLDEAVLHNQLETVRSLLDHGAPLNYVHPPDGRGALHEACIKGYADIAALLISRGADPGLRDRSGQSSLDLALAYKNAGVIALLLKAGKRDFRFAGGGGSSYGIRCAERPSRDCPSSPERRVRYQPADSLGINLSARRGAQESEKDRSALS